MESNLMWLRSFPPSDITFLRRRESIRFSSSPTTRNLIYCGWNHFLLPTSHFSVVENPADSRLRRRPRDILSGISSPSMKTYNSGVLAAAQKFALPLRAAEILGPKFAQIAKGKWAAKFLPKFSKHKQNWGFGFFDSFYANPIAFPYGFHLKTLNKKKNESRISAPNFAPPLGRPKFSAQNLLKLQRGNGPPNFCQSFPNISKIEVLVFWIASMQIL